MLREGTQPANLKQSKQSKLDKYLHGLSDSLEGLADNSRCAYLSIWEEIQGRDTVLGRVRTTEVLT